MRRSILLIAMVVVPLLMKAQDAMDLYDFSSTLYQGTAKSAAMGNAIGAVGQDFTGIAINPASLGLFRKSTLVITPGINISSSNSEYKGSNGNDRAIRAALNNIGLTWTSQINDGALKTVSFALGMNRTNNYTYNSFVTGNNYEKSLVDAYFAEMTANNINSANELYDFSPNGIYPLWETYVIDSVGPGNYYTTYVPEGGLNQQRGVVKRGNSHEISFAAGFNFEDRWYLGVGINAPHFIRTMTIDYKETNLSYDYFRNWSQRENSQSSGWGINAKLGVIVFPARWIRVGATFHTPTIYRVNESWYTDTYSQFSDGSYSFLSPTGSYFYTLTTPYKLGGNVAFIFGNYGMITADYEFVDFSTIRISASDYNYSSLNEDMKDRFSATSNIRIGTEWRYQNLCFRAGYALYGSPYGFSKSDLRTNTYSCGIGYTYHNFTLDAAYVYGRRTNNYELYKEYSLYEVDETNVKETTNLNQVVVSLKFRLE